MILRGDQQQKYFADGFPATIFSTISSPVTLFTIFRLPRADVYNLYCLGPLSGEMI